ncbi:MAG: GNAT family N-acetyltransferase [Alphaproteobacteria bacterium]|nr:GNAT family N-acetyltransferase [Alphaproteobacteria bacterium]
MTALVVLRPASVAELDILGKLYTASFDEPYGQPALRSLLESAGAAAIIAWVREDAGLRPVGFVIVRAVAGEGEILSLGVVPSRRRQGIGRAILVHALAWARRAGAAAIFLEVGEDNPAAIALYRAAGFDQVGRRPGYYRRKDAGRIAALIMRCP